MTELLLLAAIAAFAWLHGRQGKLERRVNELEGRLSDAAARLAALAPTRADLPFAGDASEPARPSPGLEEEVAAARERWRDATAADAPEPLEPQPEWVDTWNNRDADAHGADAPAGEDTEPAERETLGGLFERLVGGRLLIWLGGVAIIVAGFFLIRHSIEIGLLTPAARMAGATILGVVMVGAGEYARGSRFTADDPRIAQALVGAGIVILYATPYGSYILYGLIGAGTASAAMIAVTAAALFLSLRHGAPTAIMGLVGGFLTPALVGNASQTAVPLLLYLAVLNVGLFVLAWRKGWTWLAAAAAVLSFAWTAYVLGRSASDALYAGLFIVALSLAASLVKPGAGRSLSMIQPLAIGLVELGFLVSRTDVGLEAWGLFALLSAAALALSALREEHRYAPPAALALALFLLFSESAIGEVRHLGLVAGGITLLFAGLAGPMSLRGQRDLRTFMACAALAGPLCIVRALAPELADRALTGALFLLLAAVPAALAWLQRRHASADHPDAPLTACAATSALLLGAAAYDLLPVDAVAAGWAATALLIALWGRRLGEPGAAIVAVAAASVAALRAVVMVPELWNTAGLSLVFEAAYATSLPKPAAAVWALVLPGLLLVATVRALHLAPAAARRALIGVAAFLGLAAAYIFVKQIFGIANHEEFVAFGFAERAFITHALFLVGWLLSRLPPSLRWIDRTQAAWLGSIVTFVAAARLLWFDLFAFNPALREQWVGGWPLFNLLLSYFLGAMWLYLARSRADAKTRSGLWLVAFLAALTAGVMLMVRQYFQGGILSGPDVPIAEFYGYSLAGLLLSIALLGAGVRLRDKALRLAGLIFLTATILKVFLVDAEALEGVLRILSFLVLGIALIGIGRLYTAVLKTEGKVTRREGAAAAAKG